MKTILKTYRLSWLLTFLLICGFVSLNFNKQKSRNAPSIDAISKSDSYDVSSSPFRLFNLNNDLSAIRKQISALIGANQKASGKDTTDTSDISNKYTPNYNDVGTDNEYKQLKVNNLFNNQAVTQIGDSNYAGHCLLNTSISGLIIRSTGNHNIAIQNILNGYNNSLIVTQNGSLNEVYQDISSGNTFGILTNANNINNVLQTGYRNWIKSSQTGQHNSISTIQNGDSNRVSIMQNGNNNDTIIRQSGNNNTVIINKN